MCIKVIFICPACKTPSGFEELKKCDDDEWECPGRVNINGLNQTRHFHDWLCSDNECPHIRLVQAIETLEVNDMLNRQSTGWPTTKPPVLKVKEPSSQSMTRATQLHP